MPILYSRISDEEKLSLLLNLAEAVTEAIYGCEGEISGERLRKLRKVHLNIEAAGIIFPEAKRRGQEE